MTLAAYVAPLPVGLDGWSSAQGETWSYASATTITVPNGALYQKGDILKFTQTTVKYFYVVSISGNTLTVVSNDGGATVVVANAAITANYFSRQLNPLGLPVFLWTPSYTGFSANPTVSMAKFWCAGGIVFAEYVGGNNGTSNATGFTISLPIASAATVNIIPIHMGADNGANVATGINGALAPASATLTLSKALGGGGADWTSSAAKNVYYFLLAYPF